jgi:hypothetical protein
MPIFMSSLYAVGGASVRHRTRPVARADVITLKCDFAPFHEVCRRSATLKDFPY